MGAIYKFLAFQFPVSSRLKSFWILKLVGSVDVRCVCLLMVHCVSFWGRGMEESVVETAISITSRTEDGDYHGLRGRRIRCSQGFDHCNYYGKKDRANFDKIRAQRTRPSIDTFTRQLCSGSVLRMWRDSITNYALSDFLEEREINTKEGVGLGFMG